MQDSCSGSQPPTEDQRLWQRDTTDERESVPRAHLPSNLASANSRQIRTADVILSPPDRRSYRIESNVRTQYFGPTAHSSYLARDLPPTSGNVRTPLNEGSNANMSNSTLEQGTGSAYSSADELVEASDEDANSESSFEADEVGRWNETKKQTKIRYLLAEHSLTDSLHKFKERISWMYSPIVNLNVEILKQHNGRRTFEADMKAALGMAIVANVNASEGAKMSVPRPRHFHQITLQTYDLCWSSLNERRWTACNSLEVQQAFFLLCIFLLNFNGGEMADHFSSVFGICVAKAIESGLNKQTLPTVNASSVVQEERQRLFWELYSLDAFRSLAYGRPCLFQDNTITVNVPDLVAGENDFHIIKYTNARIINRIMASHLNETSRDFQKTMEFDSQIRELFNRLPSRLRVQKLHRIGNTLKQSSTEVLQSCTLALNIHQTLLNLYRPWFVSSTLARIHGKENHYTAQHERSSLCLAESSQAMIDLCSRAYSSDPDTLMNWAFFLHHAFNAGVCRAIQAIYGHSTDPLHHSAKDDVDESIELLGRAKAHNRDSVWTEKAHLLKKLRQTYVRCKSGFTNPTKTPNPSMALRLLGATLHSQDDGMEEVPSGGTVVSDNSNYDSLELNQFETNPMGESHQSTAMESSIADTNDASNWLDLLNNDAFTLTMADLWNTKDAPWAETGTFEQHVG